MMRTVATWLLACLALTGCSDGSQAAPGKDAPSLRIVMRMHPDPQRMREQLADRLGLCQLELRAKGLPEAAPALPSAAEIAKWVTRETEELHAGSRRAIYATDTLVWPDAGKGCQWTFYKTVHAETETLCKAWYAGSAKTTPGPDASREEPTFSDEKVEADDARRCLAEATKPRRAVGLPKGTSAGGKPCLWLSDAAVDGEPKAPGQHHCVHPRAYDGTLPRFSRSEGLSVRYVRILPPGVAPSGPPEADADRMEAEVIEEGQPIADTRFSRQAVETFVRQPLIVPAGGSQ